MYKTIEEYQIEQRKKAEIQNKFLLDVGYHREGVFVLRFPCGSSYVGSSKEMGKRLQQLFRELFVPPRKGYRVTSEWIEKAKEENPQIKTFSDLEIEIFPREEETLSELKKKVKKIETDKGRHIY